MPPIPDTALAFPAPAKLNLDLRLIGRRADGYHLLESIFCLVDLCDTLYLLPREDGQILLHTPAEGVLPQHDGLSLCASSRHTPLTILDLTHQLPLPIPQLTQHGCVDELPTGR